MWAERVRRWWGCGVDETGFYSAAHRAHSGIQAERDVVGYVRQHQAQRGDDRVWQALPCDRRMRDEMALGYAARMVTRLSRNVQSVRRNPNTASLPLSWSLHDCEVRLMMTPQMTRGLTDESDWRFSASVAHVGGTSPGDRENEKLSTLPWPRSVPERVPCNSRNAGRCCSNWAKPGRDRPNLVKAGLKLVEIRPELTTIGASPTEIEQLDRFGDDSGPASNMFCHICPELITSDITQTEFGRDRAE